MSIIIKPNCINVDDEYKNCTNLKKSDVESFLDWSNKQAHLPKITEFEAIMFLHACYYSNEAAKKALDDYFTIKTHSPEIFINRDPKKLQLHINTVLYSVLPKKTEKGYKLLYSKIMDSNTDNYVLNEQLKIYDMCALLDLITNGTNDGIIILLDMKHSTIGHLAKFNLLSVKKFLSYVQESIPLRLKEIHIMNAMPFTDKFLALVKPFMKKEFLKILNVHMDLDSLYKKIPKECLPNEYGGTIGTLNELHDATKRNLMQYREYFMEDEKRVVDESKRLGKPKNADEIFGVDGTFKKLSID